MSAPPGETAAWTAAYHSQALSRRREATYGRKLRRLGVEPCPGRRVLDLACGAGDALAALAQGGADRLVGLDLAATPGRQRGSFRFVLGDGTCLPFRSGSFDQVLCLHALHHFGSAARLERLFLQARKVLKQDGALYLIDHFGSAYLRLIFRLLALDCPWYPAAARHFGQQLREERACIDWWLEHWQCIFPALEHAGFRVQRTAKRAFFFYLVCRPG